MDDDQAAAQQAAQEAQAVREAEDAAAVAQVPQPQEDGSVSMPPLVAGPAGNKAPDEFAGFDPVAGAKPAAAAPTAAPAAAAAAPEPIKAHVQIKGPVDNRPTSETLGFANAIVPPVVKAWQQVEGSPTGKGLLDALQEILPPVGLARAIVKGPLAQQVNPALTQATQTTKPGLFGDVAGNVALSALGGESRPVQGAISGWANSNAAPGDYLGQAKDAGIGAIESELGGRATEGLLSGIVPKFLPQVAAPVMDAATAAKAKVVQAALTAAKMAGNTAGDISTQLRPLATAGKTALKGATQDEMDAMQTLVGKGARQAAAQANPKTGLAALVPGWAAPLAVAGEALAHHAPGIAGISAAIPVAKAAVTAFQNSGARKGAQQLMTMIQNGGTKEAALASRQLSSMAANHPWVAAMVKDASEWAGASAASTAGKQRQAVGQ
jgi:hypothetical protein